MRRTVSRLFHCDMAQRSGYLKSYPAAIQLVTLVVRRAFLSSHQRKRSSMADLIGPCQDRVYRGELDAAIPTQYQQSSMA